MSTPPQAQPEQTEQPERAEKISKAPFIGALVVLGVVLAIAFGSWLVRDDEMWSGSDATGSAATREDPGALRLTLPTRADARCMPVDAQTLGKAQTAFDGEVLSVDGDTVTLAVRQWYAGGGDAAQVTVDLAKVPSSLTGYFAFEKDRRYLVAANDDTVMVCGFSAPYSDQLEAIYSDAFQG